MQEAPAALPDGADAPPSDAFDDDDEDFEVELDDQMPYEAAAAGEAPAADTYQEVRIRDSDWHPETTSLCNHLASRWERGEPQVPRRLPRRTQLRAKRSCSSCSLCNFSGNYTVLGNHVQSCVRPIRTADLR